MVKVIAIVKRKAGMSVEAFQEHWRTAHADVVRKLPGLRRYTQSHTLASGYRKREPAWDGIAELWFESTDVLRTLAGTPENAAVQADEARFIDHAKMATILTEDHVIKDGPVPPGGVKNVEFITHKPGLPIEEFQRYWREVHGPIAARIPQIQRYVQSQRAPRHLRERADARLRWSGDHVVRRHPGDARVGRLAGVRADARRRAELPRPRRPRLHHHPRARHRRVTHLRRHDYGRHSCRPE